MENTRKILNTSMHSRNLTYCVGVEHSEQRKYLGQSLRGRKEHDPSEELRPGSMPGERGTC